MGERGKVRSRSSLSTGVQSACEVRHYSSFSHWNRTESDLMVED